MGQYVHSIINGAFISIFFIGLLTLPFLVYSYRKYNGVYLRNSFVVASFVLYVCCAYALIIFPLPSLEEVQKMDTAWYSLRPFRFVETFSRLSPFKPGDRSTWLPAIRDFSFIEPFFNFLLLMPLGLYLTGFFRKKLRVAVAIAFATSLFFEISQLTGLFGIYPRPYRIFDVDDLITNTSGALVGACIGLLLAKQNILYAHKPMAAQNGVCGIFRRALAFSVDRAILTILLWVLRLLLRLPDGMSFREQVTANLLETLAFFAYFFLFTLISRGQTPGKKLLKIHLTGLRGNPPNTAQVAVHYVLLLGTLSLYSLLSLSFSLPMTESGLLQSAFLLGWLALGGLLLFTLLFRKDKHLWFDRLSGIRCLTGDVGK